MTRPIAVRSILAFVLTFLCAAAHAQAFRAYLSVNGSDSNPCTVQQPCRLLPAALAVVADGGEVWMLDSANFNSGTVSVTKSVTILAIPGAIGSVVALGGPALSISGASSRVALRNLVIVPFPASPGTRGIDIVGAQQVSVSKSSLAGFSDIAMAMSGPGRLSVHDTEVRNSNFGIKVANGTRLGVSNSQFVDIGTYGVWVDGTVASTTTRATVADSFFTGGSIGVIAWTQVSGAVTTASVARSTFANGSYGVGSFGSGAVASTTTSVFSGLVAALYQDVSGVTETLGTNSSRHNGANAAGVVTTAPQF
jgi:hypothetical protein